MPRNRNLPPHLELPASGYLWRRRWPRAARSAGQGEPLRDRFFSFSLRTHVLRDAKILAHHLTAVSDQIFAAGAETAKANAENALLKARIAELGKEQDFRSQMLALMKETLAEKCPVDG